MKKHYAVFLAFQLYMIAVGTVSAQDPTYSHFWVDKLYLNPALAGNEKGLSTSLMLRYQWPKITSEFATYGFSISSMEPNLSGGIGFSAMQHIEGEGIQKTTEVSFSYAYRIYHKRRWDLALGMRAGMLQRKIDFTKLIFSDQLDPVNGLIFPTQAELPPNDATRVFNANTGFDFRWFTTKSHRTFINIGFSLNNVTSPLFSLLYMESRLPMRFTGYASITLPVRPWSGSFDFVFKPMIYHTRQGRKIDNTSMRLTSIGLQTSSDHIFGGVFYRSAEVYNLPRRDALFSHLGINWSNRNTLFTFSYGYEVNVSNLAPNTGGSHEVTFTATFDEFMLFGKLNSMGKRRLKNCPDFKPVGGLKTL